MPDIAVVAGHGASKIRVNPFSSTRASSSGQAGDDANVMLIPYFG
jgi:hypothetical protein